MWSVVCARNPITIGSNPVYLINETNIEEGGDAMDYAVFQDCVKSMDLRQRFQNLLYTRLTAETRKYLADRGIKPDSRQLRRLKQLNAELAAEISRMVFAD